MSKFIVQQALYEGESIPVLPDIFSLSYIKNSGVAFGLFANHPGQWLVITNLLTMGIILVLLLRLKTINLWITLAFGLILGGAMGNLWDRIYLGGVVDFIDVGYRNYRWPAFNLADSMICVGVFMLIVMINKKEGKDSASRTF